MPRASSECTYALASRSLSAAARARAELRPPTAPSTTASANAPATAAVCPRKYPAHDSVFPALPIRAQTSALNCGAPAGATHQAFNTRERGSFDGGAFINSCLDSHAITRPAKIPPKTFPKFLAGFSAPRVNAREPSL